MIREKVKFVWEEIFLPDYIDMAFVGADIEGYFRHQGIERT
jgi:hypothetical protein